MVSTIAENTCSKLSIRDWTSENDKGRQEHRIMSYSILSRPRLADGLGIVNSALCIVHCLAMPVLVAAGASFFQHPIISWGFVILAYLAVRSAIRSRNNARTALVLGIGWALFAAGIVLESRYEGLETLTYMGSTALIAGHLLNNPSASSRPSGSP
jgi:hypothetical protein